VLSCVIAGHDPAIHSSFQKMMDTRIKSAHDADDYMKHSFAVGCR
jgi:hypothetical protein